MEEDENRDQVSQNSMEDGMSTVQEGAGKAADATKNAAKFMGEKLKSSKMAQRAQKAKEKAAAKAKAVAKETAKGTKKVIRGATTLGAGAALTGAGVATQAAGAAMSAAGQALTASTLGFGAPIGEAMDAMGQGMRQVGKGMVNTGKKVMKHGTKTMKKGAKQIAKAPMAKPGKNSGKDAGMGGMPKPEIPFLGKKKKKKSKKERAKKLIKLAIQHPVLTGIIIGAIVLFILIIFVVLAVSSSVENGKKKDGDYSNVPYVVTSMALDKIQVYPDGQGGFTYGFEDDNGNAMTLDETLDNILETLKDNDSSAYEDMGEDDEERKEFLKLLIQAEIATQYPNLSVKGDGTATGNMTASGLTSTASGKDYCVATDQPNAATVLDEDGLKAAINNSNMSDQAKQNVLGVIPDLVRLQEQYKVNALFLIAAARTESGCGTGWDLIDPSTYNWLSVKGNENGGYIDRNGTSWNKFSSYAEASESWYKLITGSSYYFKAGKYTVKSIAPTYCDSAWGETVSKYMDEFYGYAGATDQREVAAVTNASYSSSPSQSQANLAQWGWLIQNENINAYYYEHGYGTITYNSYAVNGYITQDGKDYIVVDNGAGLYIGSGVQLVGPNGARNTFNLDLLANHGVDITNIYAGRTMNADAVDKVSQEIFLYKKNEIQSQASAKGLSLTENQIVALIDISYLNGNCNTQLNNIAKYGADSEQLANTPGFAPCGENDTPVTRAQCVWKLYRYGKYEARQQSVYDPTYFGGVPSSTEGGNTSHSGTAHAGGVDANGVTITDNGNIDFLNYAIDCHKLLREDGFYYWGGGREMPVVKGDAQHTIDCVAYVSMALDYYGRKDWQYYPHQLTVDTCITYGKEKLEMVYEGNASSINEIPDLQSGDIVIMPGHGQIFYGYSSNGDPVWLNCGGNESIQQVEGQGGWYATPILYVFRVPGGSGNTYTKKASQVLTGNDDSVQGNIKIKRKDSSGNEVNLGYIDEATFDSMISSNNPDVMNYYTLKKGSSGSTSSGSTGNVTLSGSETKEQIWNFLIDSGFTEQGAAALMGNLEAESGCKPVRVQGDYNYGNADEYSQNYTNQVDNGEVTRDQFVHNGPGGGGYGLAQWTDPSRKEKLYDYAKSKGASIGDLKTQLEYLVQELSTNSYYSSIWTMVTTSNDMNGICDLILKRFENPADIEGNIPIRRNNAASIYATYSGTKTAESNTTNNAESDTDNDTESDTDNDTESDADNDTESSDSTTSTKSFDNFLFIGDSRYVGVKSELEALGNNVSVCAVSGSTPKQWDDMIDNGSGTVYNTNITLPDSASGVSVMLGANAGASQINELKEVMQKLHNRYPSGKIYFNSVYRLGSNYTYANVDDTNAGYDRVNEEMKSFCGSNSWAEYVDITEGIHDENGYLKYPDGEGIHLTGEGRTILVENIKNKIKGAGNNSSESNTSNEENAPADSYSIAVASYDQKNVTSTDSYQYAYTRVISTNSGTTGYGSQFSSTPAGYSTTNTTYTYKTSYADYQPAVKNHTFYFDFLWAVYMTSGDKKLVEDMAKETIDSTLEITIYTDTKVTQNVSTSTIQPKVLYKKEGTTAYEDHYNGTNTTTTTSTTATSKGCLTLANVWNMEYENNAKSYSEFKAKSKEKVREKIEDDDNIMVILRKKDRAKKIAKEYYMIEEMLEDNKKVEHMIDIFKYYVDIAKKKSKSKAKNTIGNYIDTGLFDLSNSQASSTVKVLLYTSLNISEADKEMMYKAVEQMTSKFPDDDENKQRKKYIASVILNRALSSKFPDNIREVISQTGQFPNLNTSDIDGVTYSDSTKAAVDSVIQGGDCSKYSVYFNTPSGASSLDWDNKYTKTVNDGDGTDNSYSYYTSDEITNELKAFEVSVAAGTTMPSEAANKIVRWAEAQVGNSSYHDSNSNQNRDSKNSCAAFVKCAYNEAGLGYIGGNAKDLPHPNAIQFNDDGTVNYSKIPVGAIIVSKGVPVDGVDYGHVCLYVGNGYVIEAGGDKVQKTPIDDSFGGNGHNCAPFVGWGFAMEDQDAAYEQLVIRLGGGATYPEGWTPNDDATRQATGIEGYYVANGKQYNVYAQGYNDVWGPMPFSMGNYGSSACGATSAAIIASGTNPEITPIETGKSTYAFAGAAYGSRTTMVTACAALTRALNDAGLRCEWKGCTRQDVINHLQSGQPVIVLLHGHRAGGRSYGGHYVTLLGMNGQGQIFLGDPACGGSNTGYFDQSMFDLPADGVCFVYYD